ncbi:MAG TPA: PDZ domain-containing protein [Pirellulales bacterium]|nr:PDZ domain-containing protein [Pirellulales bacterium]
MLALGYDNYGVIGWEALKDKVFTIDFDRGTVRFLERATGDLGAALPLRQHKGSLSVVVDIEGLGSEECLIETGHCRFNAGCLRKAAFDKLLAQKLLFPVHSQKETAGAFGREVPLRLGKVRRFALGKYTHHGLVVEDTQAKSSSIGLAYLSRYLVTIDGPRSTIYLRPGKQFDRVDRYDLSGVTLARVDKEIVIVTRVIAQSPGEAAGLRHFDEIIAIDDSAVNQTSLFELYRLLAEPGQRRVAFRRDGVERQVSLVLLNQPGAPRGRGNGVGNR